MLLHFRWTSGAVQTEHIGTHSANCGESGTNFASDQHATGGLHGDLHLNGNFSAFSGHGPSTANHGRFDLQEIHTGFNQEQIGATNEQTAGLFNIGIA